MKFNDLPENNKVCFYPWKGVHIDTTGEVQPCCMYNRRNEKSITTMQESTLSDARNTDAWIQLRKDLINGVENSACVQCWNDEKHGHSYRLNSNLIHKEEMNDIEFNEDGTLNDNDILYWDIRNTNVCNMACTMCGTGNSSLWQQEALKHTKFDETGYHSTEKFAITPLYNQKSDSFWPAVIDVGKKASEDIMTEFKANIHKTTQVYFAGGEPLLNPIHYRILDMLLDYGRTDCKLFYNTNLLKLDHMGHSIVDDYWAKFDHVHIGASLDAVGSRAEWARYGTKWNKVDEHMRLLTSRVREFDNILVGVNITHSFYTIAGFKDLIEWLDDVGDGGGFITHNHLTYPAQYVMQILPLEYRKELAVEIEQTLRSVDIGYKMLNRGNHKEHNIDAQWHKLQSVLLEPEPDNVAELRKQAKGYITRLDKIRGMNVLDACPELAEFWNKW